MTHTKSPNPRSQPAAWCQMRLAILSALMMSAPWTSAFAAADAVLAPATAPSTLSIAKEDINPEGATERGTHAVVHAKHWMMSAANPLASKVGGDILARGGSAVDASIAAQMVLNLVEPQSSGIGGGAFAIAWDAGAEDVLAYDGRETATGGARDDRFTQGGKAVPFWTAVHSGLSVGVPGVVRMLALMHKDHGQLDWADLFLPAIDLAERGFPVSPRLHALLKENKALGEQPAAAAYFYDGQGQAWPVGHSLKNPALARSLRRIAEEGADAFYRGSMAQDMVDAVAAHPVPGDLSLADLENYEAKTREPLCAAYKIYVLCGVPPPSSGPLAVMQMLGILSHTPIAELEPNSLEAVHLFSEAGKLAFADRDRYVADPAFVDVPVHGMLAPDYLASRAGQIKEDRSMGIAVAGDLGDLQSRRGLDDTPELPSTSHIVAVDKQGNVVSMTTSIETAFGSKILVNGFLLNNQLTDFSLSSIDDQGRPVANRVQPLKRPRSSMAPMLVLKGGEPYLAIGSPGGAAIINYVAKTLLGVLDWRLDIQQAVDLPNRGSRNRFTELEKGTLLHPLAAPLRAMGHEVREIAFPSGLQGVLMTREGLQGAADPRREGIAIGD